jgi:formate/nitrite transporter FocA (FNT family)
MAASEQTAPATDLNEQQQKDADTRRALPVGVVHEAIRAEGEEELSRPNAALWWSALAAGLSMGFSFLVQGLLTSALPDADWTKPIAALGYTTGFVVVVLGRQQLFTENTLTPVLPFLTTPTGKVLAQLVRLWVIVLVANVIGAVMFGLVVAVSSAFDPDVHAALTKDALEMTRADGLTMAIRGVFAGWLIALMVWLLPTAESQRLWVIVLLTWIIALAGFPHIIAGTADTAYLVFSGQMSVIDFVSRFFVPTLIGNTVGGVLLVAALSHAQVVAGSGREETTESP